MEAEDVFLEQVVGNIENQQCHRKQEDFESAGLFGLAGLVVAAFLIQGGVVVAIDAPGDVVDDPADNDSDDRQAKEIDVIGIDHPVKRVGRQRRSQTHGGAQADQRRCGGQQAAENMRQQAQNADGEGRMAQFFDLVAVFVRVFMGLSGHGVHSLRAA